MSPTKPNCYDCRHRREVPGDAHSACAHPATQHLRDNPLAQALGSIGLMPPAKVDGLHVSGDPYGIRMGWFGWPLNFDPVWLEACDGFEAKPTPEARP